MYKNGFKIDVGKIFPSTFKFEVDYNTLFF